MLWINLMAMLVIAVIFGGLCFWAGRGWERLERVDKRRASEWSEVRD
jgi:hypothetical protein